MAVDPISLEVFKNMFISVAEEMGVALRRGAGGDGKYRGGYEEVKLAGKEVQDVEAGDVLSIRTPGGDGWGPPEADE
tara:strand:+ start:368 stop:598 length:231 start_codon:yes stop_codon:yes gene_type:complete